MRIERLFFDENKRLSDESIFSLASGKLGVRGCFEEGLQEDKISIRGTYVNGFCENEAIKYNEQLYGFPTSKQTIVNLPDTQTIELWIDDKKACCYDESARDFHFYLDMEKGLTKRSFTYCTEKGKINISFERIVSFKRPGLFVIHLTVESIDFDGEITIKSFLNADVSNFTSTDDPRVASGSGKMLKINSLDILDNDIQKVSVETNNSKRIMNVVVKNVIEDEKLLQEKDNSLLTASSVIKLSCKKKVELDKFCFYLEDNEQLDIIKELNKAVKDTYHEIKKEQIDFMNDFWNNSRVLVDADEVKQENIDFSLFALLCSASRDGKASVAAKGLSGEGYEGHFFWDCEIYIYPFFLNNEHRIAKALLLYRYSKLECAKKHARTLGHKKGALYPWRTISGLECSSHYPSGSAQYHINGDIAKAFIDYYSVTGDKDFLPIICEVILETARLWMDVGHYYNDTFRIDGVTGPDEYTCIVNNNYYTNAGAAYNLKNAYRLINILKESDDFISFKEKTKVSDEELESFKQAADKMYYPYDDTLKIIGQDDSFLNKKKIDLKSFPKEDFPLLLHYHPLYLNRLQVCKQADGVLADYLFGGLSASDSKRSFDYYENVTTHDSSLSKCIFGIVACKLGDLSLAKQYFLETLKTDLDDEKGNTRDGLHIANLGGCYKMIVDGFGGLRINENELSLFPMLPEGFRSYCFNVTYQNCRFKVCVNDEGCKLIVDDINNPLIIKVYGQPIELNQKEVLIKRKCKAVIFDLDGVITDTAIYHYEAWKKIAEELGVEFDEKRNESFKGVSRKTCLELLLNWGNIKVDEKCFDELLNRKNNYYKELLQNLTPDSVLTGIRETLSILRKEGIKIALFSVSKNTDAIIERLNIKEDFDVIVSGNDISNSKPHHEGYLLACDKLEVDPRLCVMVEDSIAGIEGAKNLSLKTIAIMKENVAKADICISSTKELEKIMSYL